MLKNDNFLRACRREPVDFTPVWIMRQAGRYMKEYRDIRKRVDFLTMCKTPELATEVTMLPVDILGVDAAILFSDILIPVEAMGVGVTFTEKRGPVLSNPVRTESDLKTLLAPDNVKSEELMPFIPGAIRLILQELGGGGRPTRVSGSTASFGTFMVETATPRN